MAKHWLSCCLLLNAVLVGFFARQATGQSAEKVKVGVYFESCCPDSQNFIVKSLSPAWYTEDFQNITELVMVPWGHETYSISQSSGQYSFSCQHGNNECIGQTMEACAILTSNFDESKVVPWLIAVETQMNEEGCHSSDACCDPTSIGESYASKYGLNWSDIESCIGSQSSSTSAAMAQWQLTDAIYPTLESVPWIVLNGVHNDEVQNGCVVSLLACVCAVYEGDSPACQ